MTVWSATTGVAGAGHVVLIHGSLDRSAGLLKLSRRLDDRFRVSRYDRRGYGRSRPHDGPFSMPYQVDDLLGVVGPVDGGGGRTLLVGHSYGGNVALATAERRPDLIAGVVIYESPMSWQPWWPGSSEGGDALRWQDDPEEAAERFMRRLIGDERWNRLPAATRAARRAEGRAMVGELDDLRESPPWTADRVRTPVLVLHGEFARDHHRRGSREIVERLPDARYAVVPGAHHFGPNTHPDLVAALVRDFVAELD